MRSGVARVYNSDNQITQATYNAGAPALAGVTGLSYDASGNTQTLNGSTLTYSSWGDLIGISNLPLGTATYAYDSSGRRVSKSIGGVTTYYLYVGGVLLCEISSAGSVTRSYTWGRLGLISDTTGSQLRFYLWDALGNIRTLLSPTGTVQWQGDWSAYGSPMCPTAPSTPFAWKGRWGAYTDSESNFLRMGVRYYAPNLARFLTRDPSGYSAGPNLYAFCGCDPLDFFDPTGYGPDWVEIGECGFCIVGVGVLGFMAAGSPRALACGMAGNSLFQSTVFGVALRPGTS